MDNAQPVQGLGLRGIPEAEAHASQVIQVHGDLQVFGAEQLFERNQRMAVDRLGLLEALEAIQEGSVGAGVGQRIQMIRTGHVAPDFPGTTPGSPSA